MDNENGSLAGLASVGICFAIVGIVFIALGKVVDQIIGITNFLQTTTGLPQDSINCIYYLSIVFASLPFLYLLALAINYVSVSADASTGRYS